MPEREHAMTEPMPLSLHFPAPPVRPGEAPDFSRLAIPQAGKVRRPPPDVDAHDIHDLAYSVIRVLNRRGEAVGAWAPALDAAELKIGLRAMMKTRAYDIRMMMAQRQGKTSFYMQCTGEEAIACAFQAALAKGDMNFPTYRQQGLLIAQDWPLVDLMCQVFSNGKDRLQGRQLPVLYSAREADFFSISGNLATQYIQAVGWAMASAISGNTRVAAAWIGEGSTAESEQPVGHLGLPDGGRRRERHLRSTGAWLRHSLTAGRRQRLPRSARRCGLGGGAGTPQPGADPDRMGDLSRWAAFKLG
jgi:2-oxoisovalerate dehydrogenase E1 component alpha subunit